MIVAIDASSPTLKASFGGGQTTDSFNPPDNSLLVAISFGYFSTITMSNNGSSLSWAASVQSIGGAIATFTAPLLAARSGMTVSSDGVTGGYAALKVYVVTGADLSSPIGATGSGSSSTNNATVSAYTSTKAGSRGIGGAWDSSGLGTPSSTDDEEGFNGSQSGMAISKASNTSAAGSSVTFNLDAPPGTPSWEWVALEIVPGADPVHPRLPVKSLTAVHRASSW
jgi:hypothetical protein